MGGLLCNSYQIKAFLVTILPTEFDGWSPKCINPAHYGTESKIEALSQKLYVSFLSYHEWWQV